MDIPKILAFDFGLSRIGVAASFGSLAEPLEIIPYNDNLWVTLNTVINQQQPQLLLVGVSERDMAEKSRAFGEQLAANFSLPVEFYDETLSSVEVHRRLHERDRGKQKYKGPIDHYAASLILQNYLDENYA